MTTAPDLSPRPPLLRGEGGKRYGLAMPISDIRAVRWETTRVAPTNATASLRGQDARVPWCRKMRHQRLADCGSTPNHAAVLRGPPLARQEAVMGGPPAQLRILHLGRPVAECGLSASYRSPHCPLFAAVVSRAPPQLWAPEAIRGKAAPRRLSGALLFRPFSWAMQEKGQGNRGR